MKVLIASPAALPTPPTLYGGMERAVSWLYHALMEDNVDATVVCREGSPIDRHIYFSSEAQYATFRRWGDFDVLLDFTHTKAMAMSKPDFPQINVWQVMTKTYARNPVYISQAQKRFIAPDSAAPVIYYGLNHREIHPNLSKRDDFVLYMGAILPSKRVQWAAAAAKLAGVKLVVAGPIFDKPYMDSISHSYQFEYVGEVGGVEKATLLRSAKALIHPVGGAGWLEAGAIVVIEALSYGTPVVASRNGCLPEYIIPGENGYLSESIEGLADGLNKVWRISKARCVASTAEFTANRMARDYMALAKTVIGGGSWT